MEDHGQPNGDPPEHASSLVGNSTQVVVAPQDTVIFQLTIQRAKYVLGVAIVLMIAVIVAVMIQGDGYPRPKTKLQLAQTLAVKGAPKILTAKEIRGDASTYRDDTLTLDDIRGSAIIDLQRSPTTRLICALHYNEPVNLCVMRRQEVYNGRKYLIMHNLNISAWKRLKTYNEEGSVFCPAGVMYKVERFVGVTASFHDSNGMPDEIPLMGPEAFAIQHAVKLNALEHPCTEQTLEMFTRRLQDAIFFRKPYSETE